jgi:hypothetical protein
MMNDKIKKDLLDRAKPSPAHEAHILTYLMQNKSKPVSLATIADQNPKRSGSIWGAAYSLALEGKIGFADRRYHVFDSCDRLKGLPKRVRIVVWYRDLDVPVKIRPQYATAKINGDQTIDRAQMQALEGIPVQQSLFDPNFEALETQEIDRLLERLQYIKLMRDINERYEGAPTKHRAALTRVLSDYGVGDPVALVHADNEIAFLTLTATRAMPIQVTIKQAGKPCETVYLEHITMYHAPLVATIQEAYKSASFGAVQ